MRDLNPRPPQCECGALSAELIPHVTIIARNNREYIFEGVKLGLAPLSAPEKSILDCIYAF